MGKEPPKPQRVIAPWLQITRASNLPTVWSNVLVGVACGFVARETKPDISAVAMQVALVFGGVMLFVAMSMMYAAGMILNDVVDRKIDSEHRADRPLVTGIITPRQARLAVFILFTAGLFLTAGYSAEAVVAAGILMAAIVAYDLLHKLTAASCLLMGFCRAMVYVTAAFAQLGPWWTELQAVWPFALILLVYVAGLTLIARREDTQPKLRGWVLLGLAAMPLLDAVFLFILGMPILAGVSILLFGLTRLWHRRVSGT